MQARQERSKGTIMINATIPAGTVEVTTRDGEFRLHASDCRDLPREERYADEVITLSEQTLVEYAVHLFADVASDRNAYGSDAWREAIDQEFYGRVTILKCVHLG
jgi:hypothetical protein